MNLRKGQHLLNRYVVTLLAVSIAFAFQNCGVEKPRVEDATYASSSFSFENHKNLPANSQCMVCHEGSRPVSRTLTHNFDHKNSEWASQDCATCHTNQATWGVNWSGGQYDHSPQPGACLDCHARQTPQIVVYIGNNANQPFAHSPGVECITCHVNTSKFDTLSDWRPAQGQPSGLVGSRLFTTPVIKPSFVGSVMTRPAAVNETFKLELTHGQDQVANLACVTCHTASSTAIGNFKGALFHNNISANPASCLECHTNARPSGAVGSKGFMRHEAVNWITNAIGSVTRGTASIVPNECSTCHLNTTSMPQAGQPLVANSKPFSGASFHLNSPPAGIASCLDCHAHNRPLGTTNFTDPIWRNKTNVGAPPFTTFDLARHAPNVDCTTCHNAPGVAATSAANWVGGYYLHTSANANCLNCHTSSGITSTNHAGFNSNCVTCHQGSTARFPNPVIADWKVNVTGGVPAGVVGEKLVPNSVTCVGVLGAIPNCTPTTPNVIAKGYNHSINTNLVSCQNCHGPGAASSANGKFHTAPVGAVNWRAPAAADIATCTTCHDPVTRPLNVLSVKDLGNIGSQVRVSTGLTPFAGVNHNHALVSGRQCSSCHTAPTAVTATTWNSATKVHSTFAANQFATCTECHYQRMPAGTIARKNQQPYKGTHAPQRFTHTSTVSLASVNAQQCSTCHVADGVSWTAAGRVNFHIKVTTSRNCNTCHVAPAGLVTSTTTGVSFNHSTVQNIGDCVTCHQASVPRIAGRTPAAADWDGGTAAPLTYTIPSRVLNGVTIPGYTGTHTTNTNCASCHATGNYSLITDFDHQGLPAGENSCVTCHLGTKASVAGFIASTAPIIMRSMGDRHHPTSIFNGKNTSCVGCHTTTRGANTFNNTNGIVYPTASRAAYVAVGCGSVNGTTYSCHEGNQRTMTVPSTTNGGPGNWK